MRNRNVVSILIALCAGCGGGGTADPYGDGSFADPAAFLAFGSSDRAVTLAWVPVPGATGYILERGTDPNDFQPLAALDATATDYLDVDVTATTYTYRVHAFGDAGISPGITHTATPNDDPPWITPDEAPTGLPIMQMVGAAGATIMTEDGQATITIPPQAFASDTQVTVMSIVNPIPGDPRPGVDVTFSQDFAQPVRISLASDETDANDLVVVRKQDDGSWLAQQFDVDATSATLTFAVDDASRARRRASRSHVRVLPPLRSTFIAPRFVRVGLPLGSTGFAPMGLFSDYPCANKDPIDQGFCTYFYPLGQLMRTINAKELSQPIGNNDPGYATSWTVEGVVGGTPSAGTIKATGSYGGFYIAPDSFPSSCSRPCRVAVTFEAVNTATGGPAASTRALVELVPSQWIGTAHMTSTAGITADATITWNLDTTSLVGNVPTTYQPQATVTATMTVSMCTSIVNSVTAGADNLLTIDYRQLPPTYSAIGGGSMNVTLTCNGSQVTYDLPIAWLPLIENEVVINNASELHDARDMGAESYSWDFHSNP